jgi:hypothetical protein
LRRCGLLVGSRKEDPADLAEAEKMLRAFAAMEKGSG